jgi:ABC-2 type transport system ATP-binding protein
MLIYQFVSKRFRDTVVLDGVSVEFGPGVVHALLGPNGSGKSTLMKMALGLVRPDSGRVVVGGADPVRDPVSARQIVGYCPEEVVFFMRV